MVHAMKPGSVIVDLAASGGGNCELTVPGERIVTENGVTIIGYRDLTSRMPAHTSQLYGTNIVNLFKLLTPGRDGVLTLDLDDVVQRSITVTKAGEVRWPPPPVQVSAAPKAEAAVAEKPRVPTAAELADNERRRQQRLYAWFGVAAVLVGLAITFSPDSFQGYFTVFILAVFVGFYVITNVTASLHTPLMAQTNAISGIILVGALLQLGSTNVLVVTLAFIAATVASINIFGGFAVAGRMISMFRKDA
jgi:NAD(P) transhydrogenase subunit alpha